MKIPQEWMAEESALLLCYSCNIFRQLAFSFQSRFVTIHFKIKQRGRKALKDGETWRWNKACYFAGAEAEQLRPLAVNPVNHRVGRDLNPWYKCPMHCSYAIPPASVAVHSWWMLPLPVSPAVNESLGVWAGKSELIRNDAGHIPPLDSVGYRNWCALTTLAWWATQAQMGF